MQYDLHVHSHHSVDGFASPKVMIRAAKKKGLSGVAIADHNTIRGGLEGRLYASSGFTVIVGAEISTERGEVMGLFLSEEIHSRLFEEVVDHIDEQGGMVVIPHPFDRSRRSSFRIAKNDRDSISAIETCNARCLRRQYNEEARAWARRYGVPETAGSDAHFPQEIGRAGIGTEWENVRDAIERRKCTVYADAAASATYAFNLLTKGAKLWRELGKK